MVLCNNTYSTNSSWGRPANLTPIDIYEVDKLFHDLITLCSPHGQEYHVVNVLQNFLYPFLAEEEVFRMENEKGSMVIDIGEKKPKTIFSSHMDIVGFVGNATEKSRIPERIVLMEDRTEKKNEGMLWGCKYGANGQLVPSNLGADDKVGCFIMAKMIEARIPGRYIFHAGEERGCIGSNYILKTYKKEILGGIERAIAFDRAGYNDVIAHQHGQRCSSEAFSRALALKLNKYLPPREKLKPDVHGVYTDTAVYMDVIPEVCNLSVGYFNQHGDREYTDYYWLVDHLLPAILKTEFEDLPTVRDPTKKPTTTYHYGGSHNYTGNAIDDLDATYFTGGYSNLTKKWSDCDGSTPIYDLPAWGITDGFVPNANPTAFQNVILRFLYMNVRGVTPSQAQPVTRKFAGDLAELLEVMHYNIDENKMLRTINKKQHKMLVDAGLIKASPQQKQSEPTNLDIQMRKQFLMSLVAIADTAKNYYMASMSIYLYNAETWLKKHGKKSSTNQFRVKDIRTLNKLIYGLTYILDISDEKSEALETLLDRIGQYILKHDDYPGFEMKEVKLIEHSVNLVHSPTSVQ